jgi:hypothetical protein
MRFMVERDELKSWAYLVTDLQAGEDLARFKQAQDAHDYAAWMNAQVLTLNAGKAQTGGTHAKADEHTD